MHGSFLHPVRWPTRLLVAILGLALTSLPCRAQEPGRTDAYGTSSPDLDLRALQSESRFTLFGSTDRAVTGMRPKGQMEYFMTNTGIIDAADLNMDAQPDLHGCATCPRGQWFDVSPIYAASREDWLRVREDVPSLNAALGGGWTASRNLPTLGIRDILASDNQLGVLSSGATSTTDGSCRDFSGSGPANSNLAAGLTLLAGSDCSPTWPVVGGVPTFLGGRPISRAAFRSAQAAHGQAFRFDWWRVDPSLVDSTLFFGHFQTYGAYDDYNSAMIARFGDVVPGGTGAPSVEGWPLGIRTEFDAFVFPMATVSNTLFWRALIINETERVYGVPLDYEKLYLGYTFQPIRTGNSSFYAEVWRGAILSAEAGTGNPRCPGAEPPGIGNLCADGDIGFDGGVTGVVVLKSPIGDLRNVLLTCSTSENPVRSATRSIPCSTGDFNDPLNPHAGDTITYNHFRMCPFGPCSNNTVRSNDRQLFGGISANVDDVLNGRAFSDLSAAERYFIFRNPNFPDVSSAGTRFAFWVPGTWDYTANGSNGPLGDTIFVPTCYGSPALTIDGQVRGPRENSCVVTWSDTMPKGELGNPAYDNREGNISFWSVGPFALAARDTTALVIALVAGPDSARFDEEVNRAIELYLKFWLSPQPPPKVTVVGTQVEVGSPAAPGGSVTLYWDEASDDFVDPFLEDFADELAAATDGALARLRALNPGLEGAVRARARDNLERILMFKSCDGGRTFTRADAGPTGALDCDADPDLDDAGSPTGTGWRAYASLPVAANADAPNSFRDALVIPGQTYLYVVLGETRGASFAVVDSVDTDGDGTRDAVGAETLDLAPRLTNVLSRSLTEPNVVSVYVPASAQPGSSPAQARLAARDPAGSTLRFEFVFTGSPVVPGRYRAVFGNDASIVELLERATGARLSTRVTLRDTVTTVDGPAVVDSLVLVTAHPNGVTFPPSPLTTVVRTGVTVDTVETTLGGLRFLLVREDTGEPLLLSQRVVLRAPSTDPSFLDRRDAAGFTGFPGFLIEAGGAVPPNPVYVASTGDTVPPSERPTLTWDTAATQTRGGSSAPPTGEYAVEFAARAFGPGAPFRLNLRDPAATDADFDASLAARRVTEIGRVDTTTARAISEATFRTITLADLVPVLLPFHVRNLSFDRPVDVAMLARASDRLLLGDPATGDTVSVTVAPDRWVPGDTLYFIERIERDSMVGSNVILDASGRPIRVRHTEATFRRLILSCEDHPRPSCNPVTGNGATGWVSPDSGQILRVVYPVAFSRSSELAFDVTGPVVDGAVVAAGRDVRAQVDSVKVVPNPYILFSEYEVGTSGPEEARILFTHLPPTGTIRIFTANGRFVQQLSWTPSDLAGNGDLFWDLKTQGGRDLASGLYVFVLQATDPATGAEIKKIGKFVVVR